MSDKNNPKLLLQAALCRRYTEMNIVPQLSSLLNWTEPWHCFAYVHNFTAHIFLLLNGSKSRGHKGPPSSLDTTVECIHLDHSSLLNPILERRNIALLLLLGCVCHTQGTPPAFFWLT